MYREAYETLIAHGIAMGEEAFPDHNSADITLERSTTFDPSIRMPIAHISEEDVRSTLKKKFNQITWLEGFEIKIA